MSFRRRQSAEEDVQMTWGQSIVLLETANLHTAASSLLNKITYWVVRTWISNMALREKQAFNKFSAH
jgi:hypothetical protein